MFWDSNPKRRRTKGTGKGWWKEGGAHATATKIGWGYRKHGTKASFKPMLRYLATATRRGKHKGTFVVPASLRRYRKGRSPVPKLEARREWYTAKKRKTHRKTYGGVMSMARKHFGTLLNRKGRRGASAYQRFVSKFIRSRRVSGPGGARSAMKAAARAWRGGGKSKSRRNHGGGWNEGWNNNPVLPIAYSNKRRKHGKRRGARRNPVLPMAWSNRRRGRRSGGYRSNAVLPYMAYSNPMVAVKGTIAKLTNKDLWLKTILPLTAGYVGAKLVSFQLVKLIAPAGTKFEGVVKHGARAGASVVLSIATGFITKNADIAAKVLAGGLVATLAGILEDVIGTDYKAMLGDAGGMGDLAADLTEELKARISEGIKQSAGDNGVSAFVTQQDLKSGTERLGDFVTSQGLSPAGTVTPDQNRPGRAGGGSPLADLATFQDAMMDGALI